MWWRFLCCFFLLARSWAAFHSPLLSVKTTSRSWYCPSQRLTSRHPPPLHVLHLSDNDSNNLVEDTPSLPKATTAQTSVETTGAASTTTTTNIDGKNNEAATSAYPINLPSPLLLGSSIVLSIASIGSVFELTTKDGDLPLGLLPTAAIAVLGIPACFFLFYAAVLKGKAETEEDDKVFKKDDNKK